MVVDHIAFGSRLLRLTKRQLYYCGCFDLIGPREQEGKLGDMEKKLNISLSFLLSYLILTSWSIKKHSGGKYQLKLECKLGFVHHDEQKHNNKESNPTYYVPAPWLVNSMLSPSSAVSTILLKPKSVILAFPCSSNNMFPGFFQRETQQWSVHLVLERPYNKYTHIQVPIARLGGGSPSNHSEWYPDVLHRLKGYSDISSH